MLAPAGTPREIIARANAEIAKGLAMPEMRDKVLGLGAEPVGGSPEDFGAFIKTELPKWAKVVKDSGAKID